MAEVPRGDAWLRAGVTLVVTLAVGLTACEKPSGPAVREAGKRARTLARLRVWAPPRVAPERVDFSVNRDAPKPIDGAATDVDCAFLLRPIGGTTPKFYCTLPTGEAVKVKYNSDEIPAHVAASRLLGALGFFVDGMMSVRRVRCRGCPPLPAPALVCVQEGGDPRVCLQGTSPDTVRAFELAGIERPFEGANVTDIGDKGWAWHELAAIDPKAGGSPLAHVDALRIMAVLLAHWDNKAANQRVVCAPDGLARDGSCRAPLAILHDLGSTFGPLRVDLASWRAAPMFVDARTCRVSMATLPYQGSTFPEHTISEEGRQLALGLLKRLSAAQLNTLFEASGVPRVVRMKGDTSDAQAWTDVFLAKVREIAEAGPCPSAARLPPHGDGH